MEYSDIVTETVWNDDNQSNFSLKKPLSAQITGYLKEEKENDQFVSYTIMITFRSLDNRSYSINRRFNEFDWLHKRLSEAYPLAIIPPLPSKNMFSMKDKFDTNLLNERQINLQYFLDKVVDHESLSCSQEFANFINSNYQDFKLYMESHQSKGKLKNLFNYERIFRFSNPKTSLMEKEIDYVSFPITPPASPRTSAQTKKPQQTSAKVTFDGVPVGSAAASTAGLLNPSNPHCFYLNEFDSYATESDDFVKLCERMCRVTDRISVDMNCLGGDLRNLADLLNAWPKDLLDTNSTLPSNSPESMSNTAVEAPVASTSNGETLRFNRFVESPSHAPLTLAASMKQIGLASAKLSHLLQRDTKRRWGLLGAHGRSAKAMLKNREDIEYNYLVAEQKVHKVQEGSRNPGGFNPLKWSQKSLPELTDTASELQERLVQASQQSRGEYGNWQANRQQEVLAVLEEMVDAYITYWGCCASVWDETARNLLTGPSSSSPSHEQSTHRTTPDP